MELNKADIGRELKVSELVEKTVVVVGKDGRMAMITVWVYAVYPKVVTFAMFATEPPTFLIVKRCGEDLERITDNSGIPMHVCEYLGKV